MFKRALSALCATSIFALGVQVPVAQAEKLPAKSGSQLKKYLADKPVQLQPHYTALAQEGERNAVLNFMRIGLAAMDIGADELAATAFDEALLRIETVYADNPKAAKARSKFVKESKKDFKGEPYERAMVYYYRGLLYLKQGDYENARASFRGGLLQDAFAEDQTYASDIAFFDVLSGWSSQCLGSTTQAQEFYDQAAKTRPGIPVPTAEDRILFLADIGVGPYKISDGQYGENLRFRQDANFAERSVVFSSPEIAAAAMDTVVGVEVELAAVRETARVANLSAKAKEARASASEAEAELAEIALRAVPPPAVAEPVALPASEAAAAQPAAPSGPQETPAPEQTPGSANTDDAKALKEVLAVASASASTQPAAASAGAIAPAAPGISETERLSLASLAAQDRASIARAEAVEAQQAAAKANADLAAKEEMAAAARRIATTIGADLSGMEAAVAAKLQANAAAAAAAPAAAGAPQLETAAVVASSVSPDIAQARKLQPHYSQRGEMLYFQASTRGGRPIDGILAGKAEFKANTAEFANASAEIGSIAVQTANTMLQQQMSLQAQGFAVDTSGAEMAAGIGLAFAAVSLFSGAMSAAAKPQADIRYWDNLPAELQIAYAPAMGEYTATFLDQSSQRMTSVPVRITMDASGNCGIGWLRSQPASQIAPSAPNSDGKRR